MSLRDAAPDDEFRLPEIPTDFEDRCKTIFMRLASGERMTVDYAAEQLGLPVKFLATTLAVYCAATNRMPTLIDLSPRKSH